MHPLCSSRIMTTVLLTLLSFAITSPASAEPPQRWQPGDPAQVLPGLIPAPADIPGIGRWQAMPLPIRSYVKSIKFSPNGKSFALGDGRNVRIHDTNSMQLTGVLVGHTGNVTALDWSPDGQWLASAATDNTIRLWQADGVPGPVLEGHTDTVTGVAWQPQGTLLASTSLDGTIRFWQPDGSPGQIIRGHESPVRMLDWHPDGKQLAAGDENQQVRIWTVDGQPGPVLNGHVGPITAVRYSPDGKWLASGSSGVVAGGEPRTVAPAVRLWTPDGKAGPVMQGHSRKINALAWSPDSQQLVSAAEDRSALIWNLDGTRTGRVEEEDETTNLIFAIDWHPVHNYFIVGGRCVVRYLTLNGQIGPSKLIRPRGSKLMFVDWNPQEDKIAVAGRDGTIDIWSSDFEVRQTIEAFRTPVTCVRWSPDGKQLASIAYHALKVWNTSGENILGFPLKGSVSRDLAWTADGQHLAAVTSSGGQVFLFDEEEEIQKFTLHNAQIHGVSFSPDATQLVTVGGDSHLRLHELKDDAKGRSPGAVLKVPDGDVDAVQFSPDGKWIASGHATTARLWHPDGTAGPVIPGFSAAVLRLDWRPDGRAFATASWDTSVKIWKTDGSLLHELPPHSAPCWGVSFSPDGKKVVTCGWDGMLRVIDIESGAVLAVAVYVADTKTMEAPHDERRQSPLSFNRAGQLLSGDSSILESRMVYLVQQPSGAMKILKPSEFFSQAPGADLTSATANP